MTGGFYDYRRSKLKLMSSIRENNKLVNVKQQELTQVRVDLQNILWTLLYFQFNPLLIVQLKLLFLFISAVADVFYS